MKMNREILFKAKHEHVVVTNKDLEGQWVEGLLWDEDYIYSKDLECEMLIDKNTICAYTGLHDKNGKRIWENDILMCHDNPDDLVKTVFGEFDVIEVESEEAIDSVIGWHYEVIPTDELSKCEPFCYSMPLTDTYVKLNEMKVVGNVFDNPELLEGRSEKDAHNSKTGNR
ncbi:MAG: YopX family protein [Dorea longicatena]